MAWQPDGSTKTGVIKSSRERVAVEPQLRGFVLPFSLTVHYDIVTCIIEKLVLRSAQQKTIHIKSFDGDMVGLESVGRTKKTTITLFSSIAADYKQVNPSFCPWESRTLFSNAVERETCTWQIWSSASLFCMGWRWKFWVVWGIPAISHGIIDLDFFDLDKQNIKLFVVTNI